MKLILSILLMLSTSAHGQFINNRSITPIKLNSATLGPTQSRNVGISATVGSNALTIALKQADGTTNANANSPVDIGFRSSTLTSGGYTLVSATGAASVVVSSGSTLGTTNGNAATLYVYALNNAGTIEIGVINGLVLDETALQTSTAEGGAGGADSAGVLYSTTARTDVAVRLLGSITITEATAGTWASAPTRVGGAQSAVFATLTAVGLQSENFTGNDTFVVPAGVTTVFYRICGAGGGGGGNVVGQNTGGGGGGGGQILEGSMAVTPAETLTITIGAAGTGATGPATSGGNTSIAGLSGTITAYGGGGGSNGTGLTTGAWAAGASPAGGGAGGCGNGGGNCAGGAGAGAGGTGTSSLWSGGGGGCGNAGGGCTGGAGGKSQYAAGGAGSVASANRSGGGGGGAGLGAGGKGGRGAGDNPVAGGICAGGGGCGDATNTACVGANGGRGDATLYYVN